MAAPPDSVKFTVSKSVPSNINPPTKDGWYYSQAGVVATNNGLVAAYRQGDFHTTTDIMVCHSYDGGKTWAYHKAIAHAVVWNESAIWIAPQLSRLRDGRLYDPTSPEQVIPSQQSG